MSSAETPSPFRHLTPPAGSDYVSHERDLLIESRLTKLETVVAEVKGVVDEARTMIAQATLWKLMGVGLAGAVVSYVIQVLTK